MWLIGKFTRIFSKKGYFCENNFKKIYKFPERIIGKFKSLMPTVTIAIYTANY